MFFVQLAFVLVPVCFIAWLIIDINRKNYLGLLFGFLFISLAGFVLWTGSQHSLHYEHARVFTITDDIKYALQEGKVEDVIDALQDFRSKRGNFYHRCNQLQIKLNSLPKTNKAKKGQQIDAMLKDAIRKGEK